MSLGPPATLVTALDDSRFRKMLASLEKDTISKFRNMASAADGVLSAKSFAGATSSASRAAKAIDPLKESIRGVANSVNAMKVAYELGEKTQTQFVTGMRTAISQAKALQGGLSNTSAEYNRLTNVVGISARALATAEGNVSKLGLSQQFLLGTTNKSLGVLNSFAGVVGGLSFAGAIKGSFDYASNLEQLGVSFETILGSGEAAQRMLNELEGFASSTPFQFPELAGAAKSLAAFGVAGDDIVPTLKRVGDIASGIGAPLGDIAEIYGKARVQGKLFAEDINQLTGRGIPIIQELAAQFGVTEGEVKGLVESGQVGFKNLEQAFASLTSEGGKFYDLTAKQSQTTAGKLSTLADNATAAGGELLTAFLPTLNKVVEGASAVAGGLSSMDPAFAGMVTQGGLAAAALVPLSAGLGTVVSVAPKVAAGLKVIQGAAASLFLPPAGVFLLGAAAVVGLGAVIYKLSQDVEPLADTLDRLDRESADLKTGMETAASGVDTLMAATDEKGLKGAVTELSGLLTGEAKQSFVALAEQAIASGGDIDVVTQQILSGFLAAQTELIKLKRDATQTELGQAQKALFDTQNAAGITQQANIDIEIKNQERLLDALRERARTTGDVSAEEIATIEANLVANRELAASYDAAGAGYSRALSEQQAKVGALTNLLAEQEQAIKELETAATNPTSLLEGQQATETEVPKVTQKLKEQTTEAERALAATRDYAFMLSQGVQQGVRPFDGAMNLLTTALERQEKQMASLASQNKFGENFKLAQAKAEELRKAIEELTGWSYPTLVDTDTLDVA